MPLYRVEVKETGKQAAAFDLDPALISVASLKVLIEAETGLMPQNQRLVVRGQPNVRVISIFMTEIRSEEEEQQHSRRQAVVTPAISQPDPRAQAFAPFASMMSKNPEMLEKMFMANPEVQAMVAKNPQLRHALSDPKTLQDMFNMSTNKTYYQEAMRGHDRALSNLENIPQGFQHLVQMQKTMKDAEGARSSHYAPVRTRITSPEASKEINKEPFPNPWAPKQAKMTFRRKGQPPVQSSLFGKKANAVEEQLLRLIDEQRLVDLDLPTASEDEGDDPAFPTEFLPSGSSPTSPGNDKAAATLTSDMSHYSARFHKQLKLMRDLGFLDENENIRALLKSGGNVSAAIEWLVSRKAL